jgi:hypothetical protein
MRYQPTIVTDTPDTLHGLPVGQWINYDGVKGRFVGWRNGVLWVAWGITASRHFKQFAEAFKSSARLIEAYDR